MRRAIVGAGFLAVWAAACSSSSSDIETTGPNSANAAADTGVGVTGDSGANEASIDTTDPGDVPLPDPKTVIDRNAASYQIFALQLAYSPDVDASRLIDQGGGKLNMSWHVYVVVGRGRVMLVDAGSTVLEPTSTNAVLTSVWNVDKARSITLADGLAHLNLTSDDVTDVFVSHKHWDHLEGVVRLPKANVVMMKGEYDGVVADLTKGGGDWVLLQNETAPLLARLKDTNASSHTQAHGDAPYDGIKVLETTHHTEHHMVVEVDCGSAKVDVVSDGAYFYRNMEQAKAIAQTFPNDATGRAANLSEVHALLQSVWPGGALLPGHDPDVFSRYPSSDPRVAVVCTGRKIRAPKIACAPGNILDGTSLAGGANYGQTTCSAGQARSCYPQRPDTGVDAGMSTDLTRCGYQDCAAGGAWNTCAESTTANCGPLKAVYQTFGACLEK